MMNTENPESRTAMNSTRENPEEIFAPSFMTNFLSDKNRWSPEETTFREH